MTNALSENHCPREVFRYEASHAAMATEFTLVAYGRDATYLAEVGNEVFQEIDRLEARLSKFNPASEISTINRAAGKGPVQVGPELFQLLSESLQYSVSTEGSFDITAGPLLRAWGFFRGQGSLPSCSQIAMAMRRVGYRHLHLRSDRTIHFEVDGLELDLGAIGKGYAVDRAVDILRRYGIASALVSSGTSSLYALGAPPGEQAWQINLRNPVHNDAAAETLQLRDRALSTSGNYEKFFYSGKKKYTHILDPTTGRQVKNMLAATVVAETACTADALSTAFFVMGVPRTRKYLKPHSGLKAIFYLPENRKAAFRRVVLESSFKGKGTSGNERVSRIHSASGKAIADLSATRTSHFAEPVTL